MAFSSSLWAGWLVVGGLRSGVYELNEFELKTSTLPSTHIRLRASTTISLLINSINKPQLPAKSPRESDNV
jgi:hypothetical protein